MDFLKNSIIMEDMIEINKRQNGGTWLNNSTVLITGAYGMLASYLVYYLIFLNESFSDININIVLQGRSKEKFVKRFGEYCSREYIKISTDNLDSDFDNYSHLVINGPGTIESNIKFGRDVSEDELNAIIGGFEFIDSDDYTEDITYEE